MAAEAGLDLLAPPPTRALAAGGGRTDNVLLKIVLRT